MHDLNSHPAARLDEEKTAPCLEILTSTLVKVFRIFLDRMISLRFRSVLLSVKDFKLIAGEFLDEFGKNTPY